ncbi:colicin I receptor precursor [bacterium BMS3Abin05]|nr:colicin I receptor precursor [bacterium BMS3Abin05]
MKKKKFLYRLIAFLLFTLVLGTAVGFAGTTGKIRGKITDDRTGDPLPGVNVLILGTTMGAATGVNGVFFILNVPPGTYKLRATMVGYTPGEVTNVKVFTDLTATVNIKLSQTVLQGKEVTIVAERPMVQRDATASAAIVTSDDIAVAPIENFKDILVTKAGVSLDAGGNLHIRGGRSGEIAYIVDGIANTNPFNNGLGVEVATNAIEEMSVITGSFNAEYGQALSGVINIVTKEGRSTYSGNFSGQTGDMITKHKHTFFNIDKIDPVNTSEGEFSFGGPVPLLPKNHTFFLSGRYYNDRGYLYGIRLHNSTDGIDSIKTGDGSIIPMNPSRLMNGQAKYSWRISPSTRVLFSSILESRKWQNYSHSRKYVPDGRLWYFKDSHRENLKFTHQLSSRTFYNLIGSFLSYKYQYYSFKNQKDARYVWSGFRRQDTNYEFYTGGTDNSRLYRDAQTLDIKFDLTSQVTQSHEVKTGFDVKKYKLYQHDWIVLPDRPGFDDNNDGIPGNIIDASGPSNNTYTHRPFETAFYIQDKIELKDMVINAGLRYDYFDPDGIVPTNLRDPQRSPKTKASIKTQLSPRFSLAYPITDRGKLFFSYGHFFQIPPFYRLYHNPDFEVLPGLIKSDIGNADLEPEKTVSYEVGFEQEVSPGIALYIKAYYKDIRNLLGQRIYILPGGSDSYALFINRDFGYVKGVNISLDKRFSNYFSANIDYTYQVADGNESNPTRTRRNYRLSIEQLKKVVPLDWDQTHALRINANISKPGSWGLSLIGRIESGYPYTPKATNELVRIADENSGRKPMFINFDLNAYKDFAVHFGHSRVVYEVYMKVYNMFDRKNELYVWDSTGRAGYSMERYGGKTTEDWALRPNWYSKPRQIFVGAGIRF